MDVDRGAECQAVVQTRDEPEVTLAGALCRAEPNDPYMGEPECRSAVARAGDQQCELVRDYRLLERLGEGGMGAVFKALHMRLGKIVALKILRSDRLSDPQNVARFEREMKAVGRLEHPRIVRALDAGNHDGTHYLVMEYVEGYDLAKLSRRMGPLDMSDACELARQAAEGLDQVHRNALVHRDIKPSNLMLTPDGQVKLLDLGLALLNGEQPQGAELTGVGQVMGTPDYLAPEQVESGHKVDTRADIYALGCTLYELLTGAAPFGGRAYDTPLKKAIAHVNETAPPLREKRAAVQSGLAALLERMLAKDPAVRPATPADVVAMLEPWSQGSDLRRLWSQAAGRSSEPHARTLTHTPSLAAAAMTETDAKLEPSASIEPAADGHRVGLLAGVFGPLLRLVRTRIRISVKIRVVVVSAAVLLMASLAYWGPSTIKSQKQVAMVDAFSDESRQSVKDARQTESVVAQFKRRPEASPDVERHFTASRHDLPKLSIAPAPVPSEFVKTVPELQTRRADRLSELLERTEPPDWRCARDEYEVPLQQAIATNDSARELELLAFHAECEMEVVENEIGRDWATSMVPRNFATRLLSKETAERLDGLEASEAGLPYRDYVVARL
ncbi:MAG TPA: serine/threonine-protein kinase, partial [Pirellulales bacterium]|nr:serine/threonine-protein kinase [Pirellulales bacterium]